MLWEGSDRKVLKHMRPRLHRSAKPGSLWAMALKHSEEAGYRRTRTLARFGRIVV